LIPALEKLKSFFTSYKQVDASTKA